MSVAIVVPTLGRSSLAVLLCRLAAEAPDLPVVLADDRARRQRPLLEGGAPSGLALAVVHTGGRGPAAARNAGWRASREEWIVFLDDDIVPADGWRRALASDLARLDGGAVASQARISVPLPPDRRPTDWERHVHGLENARWITADLAVSRAALETVGGFDERFPRAFREDTDLAIRLRRAGFALVRGERRSLHPVGAQGRWRSIRAQTGNADDARMLLLHGRAWRSEGAVPAGRRRRHAAITAAACAGLAAAIVGAMPLAVAAFATWLLGTTEFAWRRIVPGPRSRREVIEMLLTSVAIPPLAIAWWLVGLASGARAGRGASRAR